MKRWIVYLSLVLVGYGSALALLWHPTTVLIADGGAELRIYDRHLTPDEQEQLHETFAHATQEWWLLWSSVESPVAAASDSTKRGPARWVPLQVYRDREICAHGLSRMDGQIRAVQDARYAVWVPFLRCLAIGESPNDHQNGPQ